MPGNAKKLKLAVIHEIIPEEIFVMILKKLDFKSLAMIRGVCSKWKNVIEGFELLSLKNLCKHLHSIVCFKYLFLYLIIQLHLITVKRPCIIIAGGNTYKRGGGGEMSLTSVEVMSGISKTNLALPHLPKEMTHENDCITECSMFIHNAHWSNLNSKVAKSPKNLFLEIAIFDVPLGS